MMRQVGLAVLVGLVSIGGGLLPAVGADAATGPTAAAGTTLGAAEFRDRLVARVNHRRENRGCRLFRANGALTLAAQRHSDAMAARNRLSHRLAGEPSLGTRVTRAGYTGWRLVAENLAWGQSSPRAVLRAWVRSSGHRANLDNCRLRDVGVGVTIRGGRPWVTADVGRLRS